MHGDDLATANGTSTTDNGPPRGPDRSASFAHPPRLASHPCTRRLAYSCSRPLRNRDIKKRCLEVLARLSLGAKKRCVGAYGEEMG